MASSAVPSPARSTSPAPLPAPPNPNSSSSGRRRPPPPCWTDDEIRALIDSYRDKWYALRRGNLRASHWQDVSDAVAGRRCHRLPSATPKTAVQCRHKIEKLRKRYRSELRRSRSAADPDVPPSSSWIFFRDMYAMERSPAAACSDDDGGGSGGNHRSIVNGNGGGGVEELRFKIPKGVRSKMAGSMAEDGAVAASPFVNPGFGGIRLENRRKEKGDLEEGHAFGDMVVSAVRMLGDRFLRMEQMKMEQVREMEMARMDVELKRTEMILDSQRRIVDAFVEGLAGKKRPKVSP